jgi:RNA polymerase sigma factor (sigma-70 family)
MGLPGRSDTTNPETLMNPLRGVSFESEADIAHIESAKLVRLCAENLENHDLWAEFLRRFTGKIKLYIRGTLRRSAGDAGIPQAVAPFSSATENDLFQNVILRLVDNGCAALKRFTGATEAELQAYLAVVSRSVVRDFLRCHRALKRPRWFDTVVPEKRQWALSADRVGDPRQIPLEQEILVRELEQLSLRMIENHSGRYSDRDRLIFQLYFYEGLSIAQIANCEGIELSKTGVEKALERLKERVRCAAGSAVSTEAFEK